MSHDNPLVLLADLLHLWVLWVLPLNSFKQGGAQLLDPGDILMLVLHHGLKPVDPLLLLSDDLLEPLVLLGNQQCLAITFLKYYLAIWVNFLGKVGAHEDLLLPILLIHFDRAECPSLRECSLNTCHVLALKHGVLALPLTWDPESTDINSPMLPPLTAQMSVLLGLIILNPWQLDVLVSTDHTWVGQLLQHEGRVKHIH